MKIQKYTIKSFKELPLSNESSISPDLVFYCPPGGMGTPGLIMMFLDKYLYVYNLFNASKEKKDFFDTVLSYYPELILVYGNPNKINKKVERDLSEFEDYSFFFGSNMYAKKDFIDKNHLSDNYFEFCQFLKDNVDDGVNLYEISKKIS